MRLRNCTRNLVSSFNPCRKLSRVIGTKMLWPAKISSTTLELGYIRQKSFSPLLINARKWLCMWILKFTRWLMIDLFLFNLLFFFYLVQRNKKLNKNVINYKYANFIQLSCKCVSLEVNKALQSVCAHSGSGDPGVRIKALHSLLSPVFSPKPFRYNMFPWWTSCAKDIELAAT